MPMMDLQESSHIKREANEFPTSRKTIANELKKEGPSFYKLIVSPSTQCQRLRIPEDYVKTHYKQFRKSYVNLRVADNNIWEVELCKERGQVWLTNGWDVFFKKYGLKYGYFLLFNYDKGNTEFQVSIFGLTCCEIVHDQVFKTYPKDHSNIASQHQDMDLDDHVDTLVSPENGVVEEDQSEIKSQHAQFKAVLKRRNVTKDYYMHFPYKHVKEYLNTAKVHEIKLMTADEKKYELRLTVYAKHQFTRLNNSGWRRFVQEHKLREGDVCHFELVKPESNTYKVTIGRAEN